MRSILAMFLTCAAVPAASAQFAPPRPTTPPTVPHVEYRGEGAMRTVTISFVRSKTRTITLKKDAFGAKCSPDAAPDNATTWTVTCTAQDTYGRDIELSADWFNTDTKSQKVVSGSAWGGACQGTKGSICYLKLDISKHVTING